MALIRPGLATTAHAPASPAATGDTSIRRKLQAANPSGRISRAVPGSLVLCVVALQIVYPLTRSGFRDRLTVAIVVAFALTCVADVVNTRGGQRAAIVLAMTAVPGFLIEVLGVHSGFPFGRYQYSEVFGPRLLGVPLVIGLAWTMLTWPAALVARRLVRGRVARVVLGAWATTAGDLFLDPQMVATGAWTWRDPGAHLLDVPGVPLTNYAGWLLVTLVLSSLLQTIMGDGDDALGLGLYLWSWVGWTVALGIFLDLRAAAAWGAVAMGTVAVPVAITAVRRAKRRRAQHAAGGAGHRRTLGTQRPRPMSPGCRPASPRAPQSGSSARRRRSAS